MTDRPGAELLLTVARDFLQQGTREPLEWHPAGTAAVGDAITLAGAVGALLPGLDELLLLAYHLEGVADSPGTARELREVIARSPSALAALQIAAGPRAMEALRRRGKQVARRRTPGPAANGVRSVGSEILRQPQRIG